MKYVISICLLFMTLLFSFTASAQEEACEISFPTTVADFLDQIPSLSEELADCPIQVPESVTKMVGEGNVKISIKMKDGTEKYFFVVLRNNKLTALTDLAEEYTYTVVTDEESLEQLLRDNFSSFESLYANGKINLEARGFFPKIKLFFVKIFIGWFLKSDTNKIIDQIVQVGPYEDKWACEFFQTPWSGVNKKMVTCSAVGAADSFCVTSLGSPYAKAELCDERGLIICSNPCKAPVSQVIPKTCPFDAGRLRGNQAPPVIFCEEENSEVEDAQSVKPTNCDDTYLPGHTGYTQNKELWDRYSEETNGVCQSQFGKGIPSPCVYTVQLSTSGNPYYLCWYN